jgi:hypothetical protein
LKVYVLAPKENWICDRFVSEWIAHHPNKIVDNPDDADIIWLLADWCWNHIPASLLRSKKILASVHHIVPEKFGPNQRDEFVIRDTIVDYYHVPCEKTHDQISGLTNKKIFTFPFWVNSTLWYSQENKKDILRKKYGIGKDTYLIGSFQRDTEGHDLKSPKLEKGPDLFCDAVIKKRNDNANKGKASVEVLLAGWRRQYVMSRLDNAKIKYHYHELPELSTINDFYAMLDLYIVAARYEGGPQAIFECALSKTPIVSTDVGAASLILAKESLFEPGKSLNAQPNIITALSRVEHLKIPVGFKKFEEALDDIFKKQ